MAPSGAPQFFSEEYYSTTHNVEQLRALVVERLQIDAQHDMTQDTCIRMLMDKDKKDGKWTGPFRLPDIAPELRDMIYTELLGIPEASSGQDHRGQDRKQLETEGKGILYGENAREITIDSSFHNGWYSMSGPDTNTVGESYVAMFKKVHVHLSLDNSLSQWYRDEDTPLQVAKAVCINAARWKAVRRRPQRLLQDSTGFIDDTLVEGFTQGVRNMEALLAMPEVAGVNRKWADWSSAHQTRSRKHTEIMARLKSNKQTVSLGDVPVSKSVGGALPCFG
ncbi:hypothetical protein CERZMDRAFT_96443 [Cercospora zeae-maydis SCOH1-5]|uniref:Uncharacterized protein n=1 Tax=Cercospora zeae-maydis SCOH1-5 TaxID=717836 RepID=A0A6A6FJN1_9PEZI|nr:hypothetical protein CERZMDRAFT_96443 [Cercospora zeae-maydis SCOH1-5]